MSLLLCNRVHRRIGAGSETKEWGTCVLTFERKLATYESTHPEIDNGQAPQIQVPWVNLVDTHNPYGAHSIMSVSQRKRYNNLAPPLVSMGKSVIHQYDQFAIDSLTNRSSIIREFCNVERETSVCFFPLSSNSCA